MDVWTYAFGPGAVIGLNDQNHTLCLESVNIGQLLFAVPVSGPQTDQQRIDAINALPVTRGRRPPLQDRRDENALWVSTWDTSGKL